MTPDGHIAIPLDTTADEMTTSIPIAPRLKSQEEIIEGIERGLADIETGRTVSHEDAMTSLRKIIDAAEIWPE